VGVLWANTVSSRPTWTIEQDHVSNKKGKKGEEERKREKIPFIKI
jgi:hypothetical protein